MYHRCTLDVAWTYLGRTLPLFCIYQKNNSYHNYPLQVLNDYEDNYELLIVNCELSFISVFSIVSKFADDCGAAAQESKLVEKNNSNSRQFLTFVVVRKNRSVEEVNLSTFQNGVYNLFRTSPT